jgi:multiple sugar transport system permease protein
MWFTGAQIDKEERVALMMVAPVLVLLVSLAIFPLAWSIATSFRVENLFNPANSRWVGFRNYTYLFTIDDTFWKSVALTTIWTLVTVSAELVLGFYIALLIDRASGLVGILRTLIVIPVFVSPVAMALTWRFMFEPVGGIINYLLRSAGLAGLPWHTSPETSLISVMLVDIWQWTPFVALILVAGMQSLPSEVLEAARLDGVKGLRFIRKIMLPLLRPVVLVVLLLRLVDAMRVFDTVFIITRGGPGTSTLLASVSMYTTFLSGRLGVMAAFGFILVIIINVVVVLFLRVLYRQERAAVSR